MNDLQTHSSSTILDAPSREGEVLVRVANVHKKFCRSLRKSLWYGVKDIAHELNPLSNRGSLESAPASNVQSERQLREDEFWAVNDVSFELRRGECLGLIGHNGAGKTTLLKMLNGLIKPDRGSIEMRGRVGALIALGAGFNPILTGRENVYVNASVLGLSRREIGDKLEEIVDFAEIGEFIDSPVQSYSSGMQVRLGFAVAASLQPDILILDEVLAVGDMAFQAKCFNALAKYRSRGTAFILVSHNMHQVGRHATSAVYLDRGTIKSSGKPSNVIVDFLNDSRERTRRADDGNSIETFCDGIQVLSAMIRNSDGEAIDIASPQENVVFRIDFDSSAYVGEIQVDFSIRDEEGVVYQAEANSVGLVYMATIGNHRVEIFFDSIPLCNSRLTFYVTLIDKNSKKILAWIRGVSLETGVTGPTLGRIALSPKIQFAKV